MIRATAAFCLALFLSAPSLAAAAGGIVENGGDGIYCVPSPDNDLNGFYSLDYILTRPSARADQRELKPAGWKESSERILKVLSEKVPSMAQSFAEFNDLVYNRDFSKLRVWEPAAFGLFPLNDERIVSMLPANCLKADGSAQIVQAVVRQYERIRGVGRFVYKYDPDFVAKLDRSSSLQLSYLLVHEWLWDLSTNVERNRRINRFLHSAEIESMSPEQVVANLQGMGLQIPDLPADAFNESHWQGYLLTEEDFYARYSQSHRFRNLGEVQIDRRERDANCEHIDEDCNPQWRRPTIPAGQLEEFKFFLVPSWQNRDAYYPIKIMSPDHMSRRGRVVSTVSAQIYCRFKIDGEYNLECKIMDGEFLYPLLAISPERLPYDQWPVFKAKMTEDSFRLVISATHQIENFGTALRRPGRTDALLETVFTARFQLRPRPGLAPSKVNDCDDDLRPPR